MNIFVIPSIYPSADNPVSGHFFKDQVSCLAKNHSDHNFGVSLWGQNETENQLKFSDHVKIFGKLFRSFKRSKATSVVRENFHEFYDPRFVWTSKWRGGNINSLINACLKNAKSFEEKFGKIHVIHAHVSYPGGYIAMKVSEKLNVPFIITEHMSRLRFEDYLTNKRKVSSKALKAFTSASKIIAVSDSLQQHLFQYRPEGIKVIPNLVNEEFVKPEIKNREKDSFKILAINNIMESKGIHELLDTIARVKRVHPNIHLRIVGEGPDLNLFKQRERILRIQEEVTWVGSLMRDEIANELLNCDIVLSASRHETFGLVLAEAIAAGKPIVCTRCGGPEEIVNYTNGVISERRDSVDLAKKLLYVMNNLDSYDHKAIRKDFEARFSSRVVTPLIIDALREASYKPH